MVWGVVPAGDMAAYRGLYWIGSQSLLLVYRLSNSLKRRIPFTGVLNFNAVNLSNKLQKSEFIRFRRACTLYTIR